MSPGWSTRSASSPCSLLRPLSHLGIFIKKSELIFVCFVLCWAHWSVLSFPGGHGAPGTSGVLQVLPDQQEPGRRCKRSAEILSNLTEYLAEWWALFKVRKLLVLWPHCRLCMYAKYQIESNRYLIYISKIFLSRCCKIQAKFTNFPPTLSPQRDF